MLDISCSVSDPGRMSQGPPHGPPPGPFTGPPQQPQYGGPPQQPQYGGPPQQPQYGGPPQQPQYGGPPQQPQYGGPAAYPQAYAPPGQPTYGHGAPPANPYAPPAASWAAEPASAFGDAAGEHLRMKRGRFSAWIYVVLAFLIEAALVGGIPGVVIGLVLDAAGAMDEVSGAVIILAPFVIGLPLAYLVFRDRWRCIEAFSSRFCVGVVNVSVLFVPAIALVYANVRGFQKLAGK
jgi:hypothetical protein